MASLITNVMSSENEPTRYAIKDIYRNEAGVVAVEDYNDQKRWTKS